MSNIEDDRDINDIFDSIVLGEQSVNEEGFAEGKKQGRETGLKQGFHLGFHRGAEIGAEIGYYTGFSTYYLELKKDLSDKAKSSLEKLKNVCASVPDENLESYDIHETLNNARALFKRSCVLLKVKSDLPVKRELEC